MNDKGLLPISIKILHDDIADTKTQAAAAKRGGMDDMGGDAYHDETFLSAENAYHTITIIGKYISDSLGTGELLERPVQFDTIQIGHVVKVRFLNDPDIDKDSIVTIHLVSSGDKKALSSYAKSDITFKSKYDNGLSSMIISVDTVLGQSLQTRKRGDRGVYEGLDEIGNAKNYRFIVETSDDAIETTPLFNLEG